MISPDFEAIRSNPRVDLLQPPSEKMIIEAEEILRLRFPSLIRKWISEFGSLQICPDVKGNPKLLLLGISPESSVDDNILMFNSPDNPSRPEGYLVFSHEYDGLSDFVYALTPDQRVSSVRNHFAFPYYTNKTQYAGAKWNETFKSLDEFWANKVRVYLNMK